MYRFPFSVSVVKSDIVNISEQTGGMGLPQPSPGSISIEIAKVNLVKVLLKAYRSIGRRLCRIRKPKIGILLRESFDFRLIFAKPSEKIPKFRKSKQEL